MTESFLESCPEFLGCIVRHIKKRKCHMVGLSSNLKSQPRVGVSVNQRWHNRAWQKGWAFWGAENSSANPPQLVPQPQTVCAWSQLVTFGIFPGLLPSWSRVSWISRPWLTSELLTLLRAHTFLTVTERMSLVHKSPFHIERREMTVHIWKDIL